MGFFQAVTVNFYLVIVVQLTIFFYNENMKKNVYRLVSFFTVAALIAVTLSGCKSTSVNSSKNGTPLVWNSEVKQGVLDNGMTYFVQKNSEPKNRIVLRLVVRAGSCMEDDDQKGVAHFIEHLAFNGTEHFEKSAIVDYFEKIGMNFGADLNAYTSFEETVYKLEIPADDPNMLETALLILHDWASSITFAPEEIEKERGVVTEEWRLGQGLQGRLRDAQIPFLLKDSRFEERLPIGDMDVIKNIPRERILDFYNKWYRPEIMSVIVIGDTDVEAMENGIKNAMNQIPASKKPINTSPETVPYNPEKDILVCKDAEQKYTIMNLLAQEANFQPRATEEDVKQLVVDEIAMRIFNQRMDEITNTVDSTWLGAGSGLSSYTNLTYFDYLGLIPKTGIFTESFMAFLDECDRIMAFGVTDSEVERMKNYYISSVEQNYTNKDKITSDERAAKIIEFVTIGKIVVSDDDYYEIYKKCIPEITVEDVNAAIIRMFGDRGNKLLIIAPDNVDDIPSEEVLYNIWMNYKNPEIAAYTDDVTDDELMVRPSKKGKVISTNYVPELGVNEYLFENGVKVITKKTDFESNVVYFTAESKGGLNLVADDFVPSAQAAISYLILSGVNGMTYNQLIKKITAKQLGLSISVNNTEENYSGSCKADEIESMLQLVHLFFTQPQFTEEAWQTLIQSEMETAKNHGVQPHDVLQDKIYEILYNDIRHAPYDLDFVGKMDAAKAEQFYRERFANLADFTFVFAGDYDEEELIEQCAYYLGSVETTLDREETKYIYYDFPKTKISETVVKGLDQQGQVFMAFGGELPASSGIEETYKDIEMMNQLQSLMDIVLREAIREDKSGSYGISVGGNVDGYPERYYRFSINFGCEPSREKELTEEVIAQIKKLQSEPLDDIYIEKLKETYRRNRENNLRNNNWWINRINAGLVFTYEPLWLTSDTETVLSWITAENLQKLACKYFDTDNYLEVYLVPEK